MHLNIKKPDFMQRNEQLSLSDDLYLEKVKEMTEYYMEVDRVINFMGPHLELSNSKQIPSKSKATEDIEVNTSTSQLLSSKDPHQLSQQPLK